MEKNDYALQNKKMHKNKVKKVKKNFFPLIKQIQPKHNLKDTMNLYL